ncbi:hypothetical protein ANCDUO_14857 [Ancylostoma duodenale]|uniref:Uncharacterized protein n=1 Tax=Ancylostoma duodenale TaxID=51022 RepID=A0A0C2G7Y2_9BILA|nr:hypothetical protein ANCDUO_14857 [Ancylostoma duodenale]
MPGQSENLSNLNYPGQADLGNNLNWALEKAKMSVSIQDPRATPRHIAEQLKRFVLLAEVPQSTAPNGTSLSDAGFVLLSLKDQILVDNSR